MAQTITRETKKGRPKKGPKMNSLQKPNKKVRELIPLMVENYLTLATLISPACKS
jgi:hypothetical protein